MLLRWWRRRREDRAGWRYTEVRPEAPKEVYGVLCLARLDADDPRTIEVRWRYRP